VTDRTIERQYLAAHASFVDLVTPLAPAAWAAPVPCCPGWTVRDVLSHVAGIPDDAVHGRLDGVATERWTAAQVERNRDLTVDALLDRWNEQAPLFAAAIAAGGQRRPPIDCHTHEHDVRHALELPGARDGELVRTFARDLVDWIEVDGIDVPGLRVEFADGETTVRGAAGPGAIVLSGVRHFEVFRSRLGRRSLAQVRAYDWSGPASGVERVVARWFGFGPSAHDIVEPG
jgi:uncharacterized protein (TIGR03083 family)